MRAVLPKSAKVAANILQAIALTYSNDGDFVSRSYARVVQLRNIDAQRANAAMRRHGPPEIRVGRSTMTTLFLPHVSM
jgi:hypothetical protein